MDNQGNRGNGGCYSGSQPLGLFALSGDFGRHNLGHVVWRKDSVGILWVEAGDTTKLQCIGCLPTEWSAPRQ